MASEGTGRRLAAIPSAAVVGYSRLIAENDQGTIRILNAYRALITAWSTTITAVQ